MNFKKSFFLNIGLACLSASIIFFLSQTDFLKRIELASCDLLFYLRGNIPSSSNIVIVEITDNDISKVGRWPWKRTWHAAIVQVLNNLGAKSIYLDIIFSEPASEEDIVLGEAIKLSKNVYLPFVFQNNTYNIKTSLYPIKRLSSVIKDTGSINIFPDSDGTFRRIPLIFPAEDKIYPHIALKIASDYTGFNIKEIKSNRIILSNEKEQFEIPLVKKNTALINWVGKWKATFKHYGFLDVLAAYDDILQNKKTTLDITSFKNAICLVAVTAVGVYDIRSVPLQPEYPGIGIIATAIDNILSKNFLTPLPYWVNILALYFLSLLPAVLIFGEKPLRETVFTFLACGAYLIMNLFLFKNGVVLNVSTPLLGLLTSFLVVGTYNFVHISVERQKFFDMSITDGLTGLYNIRFFKQLVETDIKLARIDPNKNFCILMTDVDHFKSFNDTYGHQVGDLVLREISDILKKSVRSSDIVARYGGEEMIILLRGTSLKDGLIISEKVRKNVENHLIKDKYKVTISAGVSIFRQNDNAETIIKRTDQGLYEAKQSGRNRVCVIKET
ncbi:MAG: CHASE2 domain-containing protein [Candidatus Omnitrophota bacterium]|nr:CHASE2 domain-containing protein [Candidatus Omnitrophota bacterium]